MHRRPIKQTGSVLQNGLLNRRTKTKDTTEKMFVPLPVSQQKCFMTTAFVGTLCLTVCCLYFSDSLASRVPYFQESSQLIFEKYQKIYSRFHNFPVTPQNHSGVNQIRETVQDISRSNSEIPNLFDRVLKPESRHYLSPINSFKEDVSNSTWKYDIKSLIGDIFRTGYGLKPFINEFNQTGWIENGVVYQPITNDHRRRSRKHGNDFNKPYEFECYVPFDEKLFFQGRRVPEERTVRPKIILWYARIPYVASMPDLKPMRMCPDFPCRITSNKKYTRSSSAMVFDGIFLQSKPPKRRPEQVFVFHNVETPNAYIAQSRYLHPSWRDVFNWTMTYRTDSDISVYYGLIRKRPNPLVKDYKNIVANKTKMAALLMGNCHATSLRNDYISALRKYIHVDVYGSCGNLKCSRGEDKACGKMISASYKFYLSFENSICEDYITEKFFRYLSLDVILVARGGQGYMKHVPPEMFINTADFKSPRHLAEHLIHLDQHPSKYEAMLREKARYMSLYEEWLHVEADGRVSFVHYHFEAVPFCRMCYWLWNLESHTKTIPDIKEWLHEKLCNAPDDV